MRSDAIDLRSDTVTKPTQAMREAMYKAEVGDDYYRDDPTVIKLEEMAAGMLQKEAAVFTTSGTMSNLVAILSQTRLGDEIIVEEAAHIVRCENGHVAAVSGVQPRRVFGTSGVMSPEDVEANIRGAIFTDPPTTLICLESPHNAAGGAVIPFTNILALGKIADKHGVRFYLDGARIFNAAIASKMDAADYARPFDSLAFCLTKSLCAPFGSVLLGSKEFIKEARRRRQMVGGGMRQAGIMAAAGIVALETMVDRLEEDHRTARYLAESILEFELGTLDLETVQTNMVRCDMALICRSGFELQDKLAQHNIWINVGSSTKFRFVTHYWVTPEDVRYTVEVLKNIKAERE